jgi:D-lyxose ketol-isomerase
MKRSDINRLVRSAKACFVEHGWTLPPHPRWDVTDFGLGAYLRYGLVLVNLAEEPEYCEKLMYAYKGMTTPAHTHRKKKEDIICRWGELIILLWKDKELKNGDTLSSKINGRPREVRAGRPIHLYAGERVTLVPGIYHELSPADGMHHRRSLHGQRRRARQRFRQPRHRPVSRRGGRRGAAGETR